MVGAEQERGEGPGQGYERQGGTGAAHHDDRHAAADAAGRDRGAEGVRAAQAGNQRGAGGDGEAGAGEGLEAVVGQGRRRRLASIR